MLPPANPFPSLKKPLCKNIAGRKRLRRRLLRGTKHASRYPSQILRSAALVRFQQLLWTSSDGHGRGGLAAAATERRAGPPQEPRPAQASESRRLASLTA